MPSISVSCSTLTPRSRSSPPNLPAMSPAVTLPTCRIPKANKTREKGCSLLLSIARTRFSALFSPNPSRGSSCSAQPVDIRRIPYKAEVEELGSNLLAQTLYIHRRLRGPVDDVLQGLGGATGVHAARYGLALGAADGLTTHRAVLRHLEGVLVTSPFLGDGADDLRYHVPGTLDYDLVADEDALLLYVVLVVERRT